jgi:hypothetical protein
MMMPTRGFVVMMFFRKKIVVEVLTIRKAGRQENANWTFLAFLILMMIYLATE